eukprot:TRINITY_DN3520_c0_g1_i7.p1 TRINITY_DN3520_c0_g1~~TRINITY_DN3520_c0_g1_i7.p1  ORF type:complete len:202 (+),score=23.97 TRINITY_DN3520_c0_g1_i7:194-799(+)
MRLTCRHTVSSVCLASLCLRCMDTLYRPRAAEPLKEPSQAYERVAKRENDKIAAEKQRLITEGVDPRCPRLEAEAKAAKKNVLNSRVVRKPLRRNEAAALRGLMGGDHYELYKRTLELKEVDKDNTPAYKPDTRRSAGPRNKISSLAHWFMVYGTPTAGGPGMMSSFEASNKSVIRSRSDVIKMKPGRLTNPGAVTDYNRV